MRRNDSNTQQHQVFLFTFAYCIFVIYGSLVPLDYRPRPFDEAWLAFQQISYLNLGPGSRADWVANILLYIPLTFSAAACFGGKHRSAVVSLFISTLILACSLLLAVSIEFTQQFFPPRTVSQNDLIAESIGSVIGLVLWFGYGKRLQQLYAHILQGGRDALLASAILYTLAYFAVSFFPYDFVTSLQEFEDKLVSNSDALFFSSSCGGLLRCTAKLATEVLIVVPLGIFFSALFKWHPQRLQAVMLTGFIFGAIIEIVQLFLISGIAQGISIVTRILGMGLGGVIYTKIGVLKRPLPSLPWRRYIAIAALPYILLLAGLNGWSITGPQLTSNIMDRIDNIIWLPFYYHYYTTETVALNSLLSICFMYVPVGAGFWLWNHAGSNKNNPGLKITAGILAVGLCLVMETGKLFFASKHPDPTNLIISFAAAFISYSLADLMYRWFHQPERDDHPQRKVTVPSKTVKYPQHKHQYQHKVKSHPVTHSQANNPIAQSIAFIIAALLCWKIVDYPGSSIGLAGILLLYGAALRSYPQAWLIAIPALLPVLDFSPWTGRFFFSELDYFIVLTLAISLWFGRWRSPSLAIKPTALLLFYIYTVLYLVSMIKGLLPFDALDANAFANYYSHYNSLRVGKGLLWAFLLLPILSHYQGHEKNAKKYFSYGIVTGLTATVLFGIWERYVFSGLFNYSFDFRITSTFFSMHIGGAHLSAYLLLSIPFIYILLTVPQNKIIRYFCAPVLFSASFYTMLVTYSRGTYIAFALSTVVFIIGMFLCYKQNFSANWKKSVWLPLFIILIAVIATPVLKGSFIQHRFSQSNQEASFRSTHWLNSVQMMDTDFFTVLFGMGLGSFPRTYLWNTVSEAPLATFNLRQEQGSAYLELGSGSPLYIEQQIDVAAHSNYKLSFDYKAYSGKSGLSVSICEKAVHHSFNCQGIRVTSQIFNSQWQHFEDTINTENVGATDTKTGRYTARPVKLIINNSQANSVIAVKNISLSSPQGVDLIKNGKFSAGMDHWFFTVDSLKSWRTENMWVQILFDQGVLGLLAFNVLLIYMLIHLYQRIIKQDNYAITLFTSFTGFLILGVIDSPFDTPTITLLFFLMLLLSCLTGAKRVRTKVRKVHVITSSTD